MSFGDKKENLVMIQDAKLQELMCWHLPNSDKGEHDNGFTYLFLVSFLALRIFLLLDPVDLPRAISKPILGIG